MQLSCCAHERLQMPTTKTMLDEAANVEGEVMVTVVRAARVTGVKEVRDNAQRVSIICGSSLLRIRRLFRIRCF